MKKKEPAKTVCVIIMSDRKSGFYFTPASIWHSEYDPGRIQLTVAGSVERLVTTRQLRKRLRELMRGEK